MIGELTVVRMISLVDVLSILFRALSQPLSLLLLILTFTYLACQATQMGTFPGNNELRFWSGRSSLQKAI